MLQVSRGIAKARAHSSQLSLPQPPTASPRDASHSQLPSRSPFLSRAAADVYSSAAHSKPRVNRGCETLDARECLWVSWCVGCHCLDGNGSGCGGGASHSQLPSRSPFISRAAADGYSESERNRQGSCTISLEQPRQATRRAREPQDSETRSDSDVRGLVGALAAIVLMAAAAAAAAASVVFSAVATASSHLGPHFSPERLPMFTRRQHIPSRR